MGLQLSKDEQKTIHDWAENNPHIVEVRIFGSRAAERARKDSDVDIAVTISGDEPADTIYVCEVDGWRAKLSAMLCLDVDIKPYDPIGSPDVFNSCRKASHLIYRASNKREIPRF